VDIECLGGPKDGQRLAFTPTTVALHDRRLARNRVLTGYILTLHPGGVLLYLWQPCGTDADDQQSR
jgi:hypothetical protein